MLIGVKFEKVSGMFGSSSLSSTLKSCKITWSEYLVEVNFCTKFVLIK